MVELIGRGMSNYSDADGWFDDEPMEDPMLLP